MPHYAEAISDWRPAIGELTLPIAHRRSSIPLIALRPMAGYSTRSLKDKLGIKDGATACVVKAPTGYLASLGVTNTRKGSYDFVQFFAKSIKELEIFFPVLKKRLRPDGMLWISWPKKTSGVETDLNENVVRDIGLKHGLVDVKVAAVDETWSGLKFVYRLADRPAKR